MAVIKPLLKKSLLDPAVSANYTSNPLLFSKTGERIFVKQLSDYLQRMFYLRSFSQESQINQWTCVRPQCSVSTDTEITLLKVLSCSV